MVRIRSTQLISNSKDHIPFALLERRQSGEVYRRTDCTLVVIKEGICENCVKLQNTMSKIRSRILSGINSAKVMHASKEILVEKVNQQRKIIKEQNGIIIELKDRLKEKIEKEEEEVSDKIADVAHAITKDVTSKNIDISALHPIFQELIRIQTGKPNGTRYHPM